MNTPNHLASQRGFRPVRVLAGILALALSLAAPGQLPAQTYEYIPTGDETDGRFLSLGSVNLVSFGGSTISISIGAEGSRSSVEIGIFDGDTGLDGAGNLDPSQGHWDLGTAGVEFCLYYDPTTPGTPEASDLVYCWNGNAAPTMPDNDWWVLQLPTEEAARTASGNFFYLLTATLVPDPADPTAQTSSNFKVRSDGELSILPSSWSIEASMRSFFNDGAILYPAWDGTIPPAGSDFWLTTPTTYDGSWTFRMEVPSDMDLLTLWDGDADFGTLPGVLGFPSGVAIPQCADLDDQTTPNDSLPPWAVDGTQLEGAKGQGSPPDDTPNDVWRRSPCVVYALVTPTGGSFGNSNPSGNQEWEHFAVTTDPDQEADHVAPGPFLEPGIWELRITGLDLNNLLALRTFAAVCAGDCALERAGAGTPGYWMNHPEAWPVEEITVGGVTYTKEEAIALMEAPTEGDVTLIMFRALVAAMLNVTAGAEAACIVDTIAAADAWLADQGGAGSGVGAGGRNSPWREGEPLYERLDDYNNGLLCAPSRDELE